MFSNSLSIVSFNLLPFVYYMFVFIIKYAPILFLLFPRIYSPIGLCKRWRISKGHSKCTIQINWQHRLHKNKKRKKTNKQNNNNTICVGHHYAQTNIINVNKYMSNPPNNYFRMSSSISRFQQ